MIHQAREMGVEYLFSDAISIDQNLDADQIPLQIMAFSRPYETIPVIIAYDKIGDDFRRTLRRP